MPEYNFNSNARIPFRPLSYDNKDLAEAKEVVVDYVNATIYIVNADNEFINVTASATQILQEVLSKISEDPTIIGNGTVTLESGEVITIQDAITNINETVTDHEKRIVDLENGVTGGGGSASLTYLQAIISSAGVWTALGDNSAYYQDVVVTGILATDRPTVDIVVSESFTTASTQLNEFSKIYKITTAADTIRVYASAALTSDITLQLKIVR